MRSSSVLDQLVSVLHCYSPKMASLFALSRNRLQSLSDAKDLVSKSVFNISMSYDLMKTASHSRTTQNTGDARRCLESSSSSSRSKNVSTSWWHRCLEDDTTQPRRKTHSYHPICAYIRSHRQSVKQETCRLTSFAWDKAAKQKC